ncbi:MAG TPA: protein kinase [Acidimicrobiales bacterium]|nr:protein kinase [Acidimicrobiales bacterium]
MQTKDVLGTRYRLDQRIAAGGMGDVWAARDELLGRRVALKLLHPNLAADEGFRRRFRAEAKAAARLSHPGVVAVYDYGEDPDAPYLAMELVDGEPLSSLLRRRGRLGTTETMSLVAQTAEALAAAHAEGLVHRDVKPANLLLRPDGRVKVTDFGIVRAADTSTITRDGAVFGTVAYMSPEQVRGERATAASDLYSLGVVAYECLSGTRPYHGGESIAVALAHLHDPVPPLPADVGVGVRQLVLRMLHKDPSARPATAAVVAATARRLAADGDATWALDELGVIGEPGVLDGPGRPTAGRGHANSGNGASVDVGDPATELLSEEWRLDGRTEAISLAGLAEPPTMAVAPPRPVVFRAPSARRQWAPIAAVCAAALLVALLLAAATSGGAAPSPRTVTLPSLRGMTLRAAEHRLDALGLHASFRAGNPPPGDIVVGEHPAAGATLRRGDAVTLTVQALARRATSTPTSTTSSTTTTAPPHASTPPATPPTTAPPPSGPPGGHGPPGPGGNGPPGHGGGGGRGH